jgi:hypothetical protein
MFVSFTDGIPMTEAKLLQGRTSPPTTPVLKPVPVSSKKVETYIDDIGRSLTLEHENALKLVRGQQDISLTKKRKFDLLNSQFQELSRRLTNITDTYTEYKKERNSALSDYSSFMADFKRVQDLIDKNKIDYESEMKFLNEIKAYIKKVKSSPCVK